MIDFFCVGVAKCGTTSLHEWLLQHDGIDLPKVKESKFFTSKNIPFQSSEVNWSIDRRRITKLKQYVKQFSWNDNFVRGEICPEYFYYNELFNKRHCQLGIFDPKILILLRDPVARAVSAWKYLKRDSRTSLSFEELWEVKYLETDDFMFDIKNGGLYADKVKYFMDNYSDVQVVFFEELISSFDTQQALLNWLGIKKSQRINFPNSNISINIEDKPIMKLLLSRKFKLSVYFRELIKRIVPVRFITKFFKYFYGSGDQRVDLTSKNYKDYYRQDIKTLEELIGRNVPKSWIR